MDPAVATWWANLIASQTPKDADEPHLIDVIARSRGWRPLVPGETMTVTFGSVRYRITREPFKDGV